MNMFANRDAVMYFLDEIWPLIARSAPDVRFFAVGQDPPQELLALAERDPRVVVTGYVDDIRPFIRQAAVYVVPLRVGGGTRLKVLDAMAMGKAMVSTSIGCEGIDVDAGRALMVADTPQAFADGDGGAARRLPSAGRLGRARRGRWSSSGTPGRSSAISCSTPIARRHRNGKRARMNRYAAALYRLAPVWGQNLMLTGFSALLERERYGGRFAEFRDLLARDRMALARRAARPTRTSGCVRSSRTPTRRCRSTGGGSTSCKLKPARHPRTRRPAARCRC